MERISVLMAMLSVVKAWVRSRSFNNDIHKRRGHISMVTSAGHMPGADYYQLLNFKSTSHGLPVEIHALERQYDSFVLETPE